MEVVYKRCCGLDVHKESVTACVRMAEVKKKRQEARAFGTMTRELRELADWLRGLGVRQVAMESTGVYWKPVWNILEGEFDLLLVNAQHIKSVPGRKTDIQDSEWVVQLLQHGLLEGSFVPPADVYFGRREEILKWRKEQKQETPKRRFQYNPGLAPDLTPYESGYGL